MAAPRKLDPEVLEHLKSQFAEFDVNKDGLLSKQEFFNLFKLNDEKGNTEDDMQFYFYMVEPNAEGKIDFNNFVKIMTRDYELNWGNIAKNMFRDLDKDRDGQINFAEFQTITSLSPGLGSDLEELKGAFDEADSNKDGKLSLDEFVAIMSREQ